ncbi:carbohydrate ABC transporter permease [Nonomuraea sp. NPDC050404]|uniref:carbohydrate ABC transporter permease n=1 Tax=Nonomuraea sp. NPDC050404 TaxID=3155783 RepID=UPI0033DC0E3B
METATKAETRSGRRALWIAIPAAVLSVLPLVWALSSALRPSDEVFRYLYPLSWHTLIPETVTFDNFVTLLGGEFHWALINSVIVAFLSVVLGTFLSATAAFALAVLRFPGRGPVFGVLVLSFLIPFEAIAIPLATTFRAMEMQNTYIGLVLPGIGSGLAIFLLRQFFMNIPPSLAEAARIDGLSWWGVFRHIYLPLSRPSLVGAGLVVFVFQWQSFLWPLLIAPDPAMKVAPVAIADFAGELGVDYGQMFAGAILAAGVPLLVLLIFQRQFTASLASSGTKE